MCWGTPGKVIYINKENFIAKVNFGGIIREVVVGIDDININDFVMVHAGVIIGKFSKEEFLKNIALYENLIEMSYIDMGLDVKKAKEKAKKEMENLLKELNLNKEELEKVKVKEKELEKEETKIEYPENSFKKVYKISLSDTDYLQVMHYTNYFRFAERAQQELLESIGYNYATLIHKYGLFIPTVNVSGKIISPVRLDNEIEVVVWIEEISKKYIKFRSIIKNLTSKRIAADITIKSVCTDTTLMESMEMPKDLIEKIKKYMKK